MKSSRSINQSRAIMDDQFKELLATMTSGLNPVKPEDTISRTPGQDSIEIFIDYSTATGIKLRQEYT